MLVVPSWYEPFGIVVLEGMLHGLAVAASDVGGPAEILEHGVTGMLFPARDSQALENTVLALAESPALRRRLGCAAAVEVRRRWSYDKTVDRIAEVYAAAASCGI